METDETIRVLIVDSNAESREKTRSLLKVEKGLEIVGMARTGKEAIDFSQETQPDVVVLDASLPDIDEIEATEAICRRVPFCQVVILAVQVDPNYMRRAMLAGARDFIVKPPLSDELRSAVYRAGGLAHERRDNSMRLMPKQSAEEFANLQNASGNLGKIIQVYSAKGGTGCTTIATNLAIALNGPDTKTILVDGNLQYGDVAVFVNEVGYHSVLDLAPRVNDLDPEIISSVIVTHPKSKLDVIVAPTRPENADKVTSEEFFKILQYLRRLYKYVVVDSQTALNDITLSILDATDMIILVTTQDIAAIKNSRLFLSVADGLHIGREQILFVVNKYDKRIAIKPEKIAENLKQEIVAVIPQDDTVAGRAANQGIPFILANPNDAISRSITNMSDLIRKKLSTNEVSESSAVRAAKANV